MIPTTTILLLAISALIAIGLPIGLYVALRKSCNLKLIPFLTGVISFYISNTILGDLLHKAVLKPDQDGLTPMMDKPLLFILYGTLSIAVLETVFRCLSIMVLTSGAKGKHLGTPLSYGLGHGGAESVIAVGIAMVFNLTKAVAHNADKVVDPAIISRIANTSPFFYLAAGLERISGMIIQIALSFIVYYAWVNRKYWLIGVCVLFHALIRVPSALIQLGQSNNVLLLETLSFVFAVALAIFVSILVKKFENFNDEPSDGQIIMDQL
jgi:uncharacterized membrane protein YhfC